MRSIKFGLIAGTVMLGALAGCSPKELAPDPTAEALRQHGAEPITRTTLAERLSDKTVYGTFTVDTNTAKAGDAWTEYFAPDGRLWYHNAKATFRGQWRVPDGKDELCLTFREGEERCAQLFDLGTKIHFVSTAQGPYQGIAISYADKIVDGDAEGFVPKPSASRKRNKRH